MEIRNITTKKIRLFKSNVALRYGAESWKISKTRSQKLYVFQMPVAVGCRILNIFWPNTISKIQLHIRTPTKPDPQEVKLRRWKWIGQALRMPTTSLPNVPPLHVLFSSLKRPHLTILFVFWQFNKLYHTRNLSGVHYHKTGHGVCS